MAWSNRYIGIPHRDLGRDWSGCDCWGLCRLVYSVDLGIDLPAYLDYGSDDEHAEIAALIGGAKTLPQWRTSVDANPYDLAVFRRGALETHIGIVVRPGMMLHMAARDAARIEPYDKGCWRSRLAGIWTYAHPVEGVLS